LTPTRIRRAGNPSVIKPVCLFNPETGFFGRARGSQGGEDTREAGFVLSARQKNKAGKTRSGPAGLYNLRRSWRAISGWKTDLAGHPELPAITGSHWRKTMTEQAVMPPAAAGMARTLYTSHGRYPGAGNSWTPRAAAASIATDVCGFFELSATGDEPAALIHSQSPFP